MTVDELIRDARRRAPCFSWSRYDAYALRLLARAYLIERARRMRAERERDAATAANARQIELIPTGPPPPMIPLGSRETSAAAAVHQARTGRAGAVRAMVLRALRAQPDTADGIGVRLDMPHQTVSPRITDLSQSGTIEDSGHRRPTRSGRAAIVWRVVR